MSRTRPALAALIASACAAAALAPAAAAGAASTGTTGTTGKTAVKPVAASAKLYLPTIFALGHNAVTVPGRPVQVAGFVRPYVPGQRVEVRSFLGSKLIKRDLLRIKPSSGGRIGKFTEIVKTAGVGIVTVKVVHSPTKLMSGFAALRRYATLSEQVGPGSTGAFVQLIQQRLSALHLFIPLTGVFDSGTGLALDAYHRMLGWGTSQTLDGPTISYLLNGWGAFKVRFPNQGRHAEGDLSHQLLALINGSKVYWILPISSGKPSTPTILGSYQVYSRVPGYLPDGMYFSSFFTGGYAIHGYNPAPDYPASHGCMRLPIVDAIPVFNWLSMGDWVDTYYR
jgi:hypothetical protein